MSPHRVATLAAGLAGVLSFAAIARSQQFQLVPGAIGGPSFTTFCEGVEVVDLDGDGKLDFVGSTGAVFSPGSQGPHIPQIQRNVSHGSISFADEAATRLPAGFTVQSSGCTAFDIDDDGDPDLLFAQMQNRQPQLLRNDGTGVFTNITATHFPVILMTSACAQHGDVDNDGDLDVAMSRQNQPYQLFRNDGTGTFTNVTAAQVPNLSGGNSQDVSLVDVDNDWDLDLIGTTLTAGSARLYLNDGSGVFSNASATLGYAGTANNYESDWSDLDNDGDLDGFWVSVTGFNEGSSRNNLIPGGTLGWTTTTSTVIGTTGGDDNEITFIDFDDDGDLDPIVGALSGGVEKSYATNPVAFTFTFAGAFGGAADPTLDGAPGDFDDDGRMDYVSAVGESGSQNKCFRNAGAIDGLAPNVLRLEALPVQPGSGPFVFRAMIQDGSYDDGWDFVEARFDVSVEANNGVFDASDVAMKRMGGHLFRGSIDVAGLGASVPGARVTYTLEANDRVGNGAAAPSKTFQVAGFLKYGVGLGGANVLSLDGTGTFGLGQTATFVATGCQPGAAGGLLWSGGRDDIPNFLGFGATLLIDLATLGDGAGGTADGAGVLSIPLAVPNVPTFVGATLDFQALALDPSLAAGLAFSNGLESTITP